MEDDHLLPQQFPLGTLTIHERVLDPEEDRKVTNRPIGFVHFKDTEDYA